MERPEYFSTLLALIQRPAFCVCDGLICMTNPAAQKWQLSVGTPVAPMLPQDAPVTAAPAEGYLYLPLTILDCVCGASVLQLEDAQLFILEDEKNDARLEALALASQQLRTPLFGVMTAAEQLTGNTDLPQDPQLQSQLAQLQQRLYQLNRMVSNMSDAYRFQLDGASHMETVNITSLFHQIMEKAQLLVEKTGRTLCYHSPRQAIFSLGDREMLERAVYNLISNACKFSPTGSTITATLSQQGSTLYFTLQDQGAGVCRNILGDIFARYTRQPGIEDGRYGLGLGMVLVRTAALTHGGTILMEQPPAQGLKVTMTIPIRQSGQATVKAHILGVDHMGERQHGLIELADILPPELFLHID